VPSNGRRRVALEERADVVDGEGCSLINAYLG
jgi:hypothetical protein